MAATTFAACSEAGAQGIIDAATPTVEIKVHTGSDDSRVCFGDKDGNNMRAVFWETADELAVVEVASNSGGASKITKRTADSPELVNDGKGATFKVSFDALAGYERYEYMACCGTYKYRGADYLQFEVPSIQTPREDAADARACVLVAKAKSQYTAQPQNVDFSFSHAVAYGKMTLKNVGQAVQSVIFEADAAIAATSYRATFGGDGNIAYSTDSDATTASTITFTGVDAISGDGSANFDIWFGAIPAEINRFTVTYITADGRMFRREVDTTGKKPVLLERGKVHAFSVNMATAAEVAGEGATYYEKVTEEPADWSGKYLIAYENSGVALVYTGIDNKASSTVQANAVGGKIEATDAVNACAAIIESYETGYSIQIGDKGYIGHSGSSAGIKFSQTLTDGFVNAISYSGSAVSIKCVATGYALLYNSTSKYFRYYTSSQKAIQLYKYTGTEPTEPEPVIVPEPGEVTVQGVTETSATVACTGKNLDAAASLWFVLKSGDEVVARVAPASILSGVMTATLSGLMPATSYSVYAEAVTGEGATLTGVETGFVTEAYDASHAGWLELPAVTPSITTAAEHSYFVGADRNYTAYYDTGTYTSLWVAYPLAKGHTGTGRDSDPWAAAPDMAETDQINIWNGAYSCSYTGGSTSNNYYARGHQIPNADRNGMEEMRVQTYYAVNSTPQIHYGMNGGVWMYLEGAIRDNIPATDSLYVATGAALRKVGGSETITYIQPAHDTKRCPVPNYYYKVVLKVKRDAGNVVSDAMAIGFWFEHREYSDSYENYAVPVDDIEAMTGFDFFANLPDGIEAAAEQNGSWRAFSAW